MMSRPKRETFDVFVGNLPVYVDRGYVEHMFKHSGEVAGVFVRHSKFNKSKLAYVKFFCEPDAIKAVEKFKHLCLDGHVLEVKRLNQKNECNSSVVKNASIASNADRVQNVNCGNSKFPITIGACTIYDTKSSGEDVIVTVCHIDSPVTFYGQSIANLLELAEITVKLRGFCSSFLSVEGLPHINQIYAARFSQDRMWYRCRVIRAEKYKSYVSYIDYGNEELVNNADMMVLPDDLVKIPPQSCLFVFKDLKAVCCKENKEIHDEAVAYLKKMLNQKVKLHKVFATESFYFVNKCIFDDIDIYDELQKKGYAKKVSSSNEKSSSPQKNMTKSSRNNGKNADVLRNSKGVPQPQQSVNNKTNAQGPKSLLIDNTLKAATTFSKQSVKHPGKEICEELEILRLKNDQLTKELNVEREISKALKQELEALKAKADVNHFEKIDCTILKAQQLFAMRRQHSSEDASNLEEVYDVIKAKLPCYTQAQHENTDLHEEVEEAIFKYEDLVEFVGASDQSDSLSHHIDNRDKACKAACELMKQYLDSWNGDHLMERVVYLKKLLHEMEQKYDRYLKVNVKCDDRSLEELIGEFRENKIKNKTCSEALVKNTNDALNRFSAVIDNLQKDIALPSDETGAAGICISFTKAAFIESLKEVQEAVDAEIVAETMQPRSPLNETLMTSLIKIFIKEIQTPLEVILLEIEDCKKYNILYPKLCNNLIAKPNTSRIYEIRKEIKTLKSKIRHKLADKKDLEESDELSTSALTELNSSLDILLHQLHTHFKEEHDEMMRLVNAYRAHFRELDILNPDLNISSYSKCNGLMKENWEMEHFSLCSITKRPGICYSAKFCDESVVIKEYHLNCDEYDQFFKKILLWDSIKEVDVIQVHAVFKSKTGFQAYAMFPHFMTLEESKKEFPLSQSDAAQVLHGVLKGLVCIHSQDIMHSLLNPSTILIMTDTCASTPLLDFSFGLGHTTGLWESKGIIFSAPEKELSQASDMYNFGCLILWMLFPNLQFTSTSSGVLDIAGYKSIVQDLLSSGGYEAVESLLSVEPSARPTAKSLLEKDIFVELTCNTSGGDPSHSSTPVSQISEVSVVVPSEEVSTFVTSDEVSTFVTSDKVSTFVTSEEFLGTASASDR